ncbi:MAG: hypothetical protein VX597_04320 [Pseudomonadota bacterium]|nr:hypothetical protein [Pseudomonadota bacterium]
MGDDQGGSQIDLAIQTSSPGFSIGDHSLPGWEYVSVLKIEGVSWIDEKSQNQEKRSALEIQCLFLRMSCIDLGQPGESL